VESSQRIDFLQLASQMRVAVSPHPPAPPLVRIYGLKREALGRGGREGKGAQGRVTVLKPVGR